MQPTDPFQLPAAFQIGKLLRWHDPDGDEAVLCFKLEPPGRWDYGEFIVMRDEFEWHHLEKLPAIELLQDELADCDFHLGRPLEFSKVTIKIDQFSDDEDMVWATITGRGSEVESGQPHDIRITSQFHIVRPAKHAPQWQQRLETAMADRLPAYTLKRHYTEPNDYGLRYGDVYFAEFENPQGDMVLIQLIFDSADTCELYIAEPFSPENEEDRIFPFTEAGLERLSEHFIQVLEKQQPE